MKAKGNHGFSIAAAAVVVLTLGTAAGGGAGAADKDDVLYVGDEGNPGDTTDDTVKTFDATTGFSKKTLIPASAKLDGPHGLVSAMGDLLVVNQNINLTDGPGIPGEVLRFDNETRALLKRIVPALLKDGSNNPNAPGAPDGMVLWNNRIFVADVTDDPNNVVQGSVREYSADGRLILPLMKPPANQLDPASFHPRGVVIGPDSLLYVSNMPIPGGPNGHVLRFDPAKRKFIDIFVENDGSAIGGGCAKNLNRPDGLVFGPDGRLYVTTFRANGKDPKKLDTDAILIFEGPHGKHPGRCVDQIDLDAPGTVNSSGLRAFAQALLFGPQGYLFVPISGNGQDTGAIRRYDIRYKSFTDFVPASTSPLGSPQYLTFGKTDPGTLAYDDDEQGE
jgi:hypothetical protein